MDNYLSFVRNIFAWILWTRIECLILLAHLYTRSVKYEILVFNRRLFKFWKNSSCVKIMSKDWSFDLTSVFFIPQVDKYEILMFNNRLFKFCRKIFAHENYEGWLKLWYLHVNKLFLLVNRWTFINRHIHLSSHLNKISSLVITRTIWTFIHEHIHLSSHMNELFSLVNTWTFIKEHIHLSSHVNKLIFFTSKYMNI